LIASPQFKSYIDTIITGVNVPHISGRDIKRFSFRLPDEHTQERVVDVLSSYDGLIENNRRRIALLEEAAGQLYREWFDRLRFPGYEHTRIADGVPDGWRNVTFGDCATMLSGGTPSKKNSRYWDGDIPWVTAKDLKVNRILDSKNHVTDDGADNGTRRVPAGTILFVVRGMSLAKEFRVAVATREVTFNQDLKALRIKEGVAPHFLFNFLMASKRQIMGICGEAAHGTKKLETDRLLSLPVLLPDDRIQRQYVEFAKPTFDLMQRLEQQSLRLAEARDLLLPRLISGEVEV
jgi:type I restriction enzyme S subunit